MTTATVVLAAAGLVSALVLMARVRVPLPASGRRPLTAVFVVVPARDEAARLPRLLASLAAQTVPPDRVVVVDDDSTDATADVARAAGAHVVTTTGPPPDWAGKTWACHTGAASLPAATDDVIVFLDADVWLAPDGLGRLVEAHDDLALDGLLSVQPYHVTERPYEQLSAIANVVPVMASGMATIAAPGEARVAFGPCLVTTAGALASVGGFASVAGETVEDAALARRYRAADRAVQCLAGGSTVRFRMYGEGLRSLVEGWTKNLAGGARRTALAPTVGAVAWVTGALAVALTAVTDPSPAVAAWWAAYAVQCWWMLRRLGRFRLWTSVLFPVPTVAFVGLFTASVVARGLRRRVSWRGRRIPVGR